MTDTAKEIIAAMMADETEYVCINGHDLCAGGFSAGSDCPYCERRVSTKGRILSDISTLAEQAIARAEKAEADLAEARRMLKEATKPTSKPARTDAEIREIVRRRFGPAFSKPCLNPAVSECAFWACQSKNECQYQK